MIGVEGVGGSSAPEAAGVAPVFAPFLFAGFLLSLVAFFLVGAALLPWEGVGGA